MNFSPFTTQFANVNVNQFAKFAQTLSAPSQVLSLVSGSDGNVQFLQAPPAITSAAPPPTLNPTQTYITLPITIPPSKPGDASQTFQIQVLNPNPVPQPPKFQIPISLQQHGMTVLTVAYSPQDGEILPNQMPENGGGGPVTVLAAIQPQDLQLLAQQNGLANAQQQLQVLQHQQQQLQAAAAAAAQQQQQLRNEEEMQEKERRIVNIKPEPSFWNQPMALSTQNPHHIDLSEFLQSRNITMQPLLKFNTEGLNIKKEIFTSDAVTQINSNNDNNNVLSINNNNTSSSFNGNDENSQNNVENSEENGSSEKPEIDINGKVKKKRKMKKKPPKPKRPKPGQVHIATAIDGTILFCCPECQMAYPEKESLEQHLAVHKIERRYICDICGAGLKRKEHLERHKLGHNPERPYVCPVCLKGFKRKEHLNLHAVIHSGNKTEVCSECGKGFYRKDHLRKHIKSHLSKRLKEEASGGASVSSADAVIAAVANGETPIKQERPSPLNSPPHKLNDEVTIAPVANSNSIIPPFTLPQEVTIHVQSNNTTLPVQIQLPQLIATTSENGEVVMKMTNS